MFKKTMLLTGLTVFAGCASTPPPAPTDESPAPVEISESASAEAPTPDPPPPPDAPEKPQQTDTGRFRISIASLDTVEATAPSVSKAEAAGYRTEVLAVEIDGKTWQRVLLPGYASLAEAQAALPFVQQELGAPSAWVTSRRRAPEPADAPAEAAPPPPAPDMPAPPVPEASPTPAN